MSSTSISCEQELANANKKFGFSRISHFNSASHFAKDVLTLNDMINDWFSLNKNDLTQKTEWKRK